MSDAFATLLGAAAPVTAPPPVVEPPAHFMATFAGLYYKPTGKNQEKLNFNITVKVPMAWLSRLDYLPQGFFKKFIAPRVMVKEGYEGFNGIAKCQLIDSTGLPDDIDDVAFLNWTADRAKLEAYAKRNKMPIKPELYVDADDLRRAIKRCHECRAEKGSDESVFVREQAKRETGKSKVNRDIAREFEALGY